MKAVFTEGDLNSMKKTVLTFGVVSGAVSVATMLATIPFADAIGGEKGEILGYTIIVLSALMVFFGVRSYRENAGNGRLTFGRGFAVGILITLISSACYVGTWEIVYFKLMPGFAEKYAAHTVERAKASGASQQKMDETERQAKQFKQMYDNPAINVALTFTEVFPIESKSLWPRRKSHLQSKPDNLRLWLECLAPLEFHRT
jgi:hypothetical protein